MRGEFVVFDLETTGLSPEKDAIVEIGAIRIRNGAIEPQPFSTLIRPLSASGEPIPIPYYASKVHGITDQMVSGAPTISEALPQFLHFVGEASVVAHNVAFDSGFVRVAAERLGLRWEPAQQLCTVKMSRRAFPKERSHNLDALSKRLGLSFAPRSRHRSLVDVQVTAQAFLRLMERLG